MPEAKASLLTYQINYARSLPSHDSVLAIYIFLN